MKRAKKTKSTLIILLLSTTTLFAQDFDNVYFNANWAMTSIDKATYYRVSGFDAGIPAYDSTVTDYYLANDQIEMTGKYENGTKWGDFSFYYPDGQLKMVAAYKGNERVGNWKEFYSNGVLKISVEYANDMEKLLALNDSLGNSMIVRDKIAYKLTYPHVPQMYSRRDEAYPDEVQFITGKVKNTLRDGKWEVTKEDGGERYAWLKYKMGKLESGYVYMLGQKIELYNNMALPLIVDPLKFTVTETFIPESGAVMKNNYILEALNRYQYKTMEKVTIHTYEELERYVHTHFDMRSQSDGMVVTIQLETDNGRITGFTTDPSLSDRLQKELSLIFDTIDKITFKTDNPIVIKYKVAH